MKVTIYRGDRVEQVSNHRTDCVVKARRLAVEKRWGRGAYTNGSGNVYRQSKTRGARVLARNVRVEVER